MAADLAAISAGLLLFPLVSLFPGYALGWLLDAIEFRKRTLGCRLALSLPISIALVPIIAYLSGLWLSINAAMSVCAGLCAFGLVLFTRDLRSSLHSLPRLSKVHFQILAVGIAWGMIAILSLADFQIGHRLYFSIIGLDYAVRTAFTNSISVFGLPARNPFFFPGHAVGLRYHYYWLILPALIHRTTGRVIEARQLFIASTVWCGVGLFSVIALYLRFFSPKASCSISRRVLMGALLLGVTGLDILPTLLLVGLRSIGAGIPIAPSVEWWNDQVDGWMYTMLWEPHCIASLIACLMGFLLIWNASLENRRWIISGITAGAAFATGVGASIYVALVFAIFLALWTAITGIKKWYRETGALILAGAVAFLLSIPFLSGLREPGSGGALIQPTLRPFLFGEIVLKTAGFNRTWQILIGNFLFLPVNYFLELGFFFGVAMIVWRRFVREKRSPSRYELAGFAMAAVSIAVCTFFRSGVIGNNDLGWRGFLIAQFVLLIWAIDVVSSRPIPVSNRQKRALTVLLVLGAAGVVYDLGILRLFPMLSDAGIVPRIAWLATDQKLGSRTYANREAYEWLKARIPVDATVQQNPRVVVQDTFFGLYGSRQTVAEDSLCGTIFGGDPVQCAPVARRAASLYFSQNSETSLSFDTACEQLPVDVFVARDTDAVWKDASSWVWTRKPMFANSFVRLFACPRNAREGAAKSLLSMTGQR